MSRPTLGGEVARFPIAVPLPGALWMMRCPPGGPRLGPALGTLGCDGIDAVVSLLPDHEVRSLDVLGEPAHLARLGIDFLSCPITDYAVPDDLATIARLGDDVVARLTAGQRVVVHCRGGIGRSGLVACAVLVRVGATARTAFALASAARGVPGPETAEQRAFVERLERWWRGRSVAPSRER